MPGHGTVFEMTEMRVGGWEGGEGSQLHRRKSFFVAYAAARKARFRGVAKEKRPLASLARVRRQAGTGYFSFLFWGPVIPDCGHGEQGPMTRVNTSFLHQGVSIEPQSTEVELLDALMNHSTTVLKSVRPCQDTK